MTKPKSKKFILASASARRKELLEKACYKFDIIPSDVDEEKYSSQNISPADYAAGLALAKAKDVAQKFPDRLVMGADTIADFDGEIIGKASSSEHAEEIVRKLFSKPHKIITAVALVRIKPALEIVETDTTIVYPNPMSEKQIDEHIKSRSWEGKAGAYAIQETGDEFVTRIEGSFTNVMGLPMELVAGLLNKYCK